MTVPVHIGTAATALGASPLTVVSPSATAGNKLICQVTWTDVGTVSAETLTVPAGWTADRNSPSAFNAGANGATGIACFSKTAAGGVENCVVNFPGSAANTFSAGIITEWPSTVGLRDTADSTCLVTLNTAASTTGATIPNSGTLSNPSSIALVGVSIFASTGLTNAGISVATGFTTIFQDQNSSADVPSFFAYKSFSGTGAQGAVYSWTTDSSMVCAQAALTIYSDSANAAPLIGARFRPPFGPGKSPDPRMFFKRRNLSNVIAQVASAFGVGSPTEGNDTAAGVGNVTNSGSGTPTEGHDTASGTGTVLNTGSGAPTEGADTAAGSGTGSTSGSGSPIEGADTAAGTGTVTATGTGSPTEGADTAAGTGTVANTGSGSPTEGSDTAAGTGTTSGIATGTGSPTEGSDTAAGTGTVANSGTGSPTEGSDTAAGVGKVTVSGSGSPTEGADTAAGTGTASGIGTGSGAPTEGHDTASGTGTVTNTASGAPTEGSDTAAGVGKVTATGTGSPTEGSDTAAGTGTVATSGSGSPTEDHDTASGTGIAAGSGSGSGSPTEGHDAASGTGTHSGIATGTGSPTEGADTAAGAGKVTNTGSGSPTEGADTAAGTGTTSGIASGSGSPTEGADVPAGAGTVTATGTGSPAEGSDIAAGAGTAGFPGSGSGSPTEGSDTAAGIGVSVPLLQPVRTPFNLGLEGTFVTQPRYLNLQARYPAVSSVGMRTVSNSEGTILARFGWRDPSGIVNNKRETVGDQVGMVLPYSTRSGAGVVGFYGRSWTFYDGFYWRIRPNLMTAFMTSGNFWARFAGGAYTGQPVYASLVDGAAISGETGGAELTPWIVCSNAAPGQLAMISTSPKFGA